VHENLPSQLKKHISIGGRQTHLVVYKRRFYCDKCQKTYNEQLDMVKKHQRHTDLLEDEVIRQLKEMSFEATKRTTGVHYQKQVEILKKTMRPFEANWKRESKMHSFSIGMDGHSFSKHDMVLTVTNLDIPRVVSILHTDSKKDIDKFLKNIPPDIKQKISAVCIDMSAGYRSSIEKHLSSSKIVIDKFHIIQDANRRIDEERVIVNDMTSITAPKKLFLVNKENLTLKQQELIKKWFKKIPDLEVLWFFKEGLREMYASKDYQQAKRRLDTIISGLYKQRSKNTSDWAKTLERWYEPILNYFEYMITNGYTEGMHTKFKLLKRLGYGFKNKDVYIRKMALGCLPLALLLPH
jgi:transposase